MRGDARKGVLYRDLIYEGIATVSCDWLILWRDVDVGIDLAYEGIATKISEAFIGFKKNCFWNHEKIVDNVL